MLNIYKWSVPVFYELVVLVKGRNNAAIQVIWIIMFQLIFQLNFSLYHVYDFFCYKLVNIILREKNIRMYVSNWDKFHAVYDKDRKLLI